MAFLSMMGRGSLLVLPLSIFHVTNVRLSEGRENTVRVHGDKRQNSARAIKDIGP